MSLVAATAPYVGSTAVMISAKSGVNGAIRAACFGPTAAGQGIVASFPQRSENMEETCGKREQAKKQSDENNLIHHVLSEPSNQCGGTNALRGENV